MNFGFHQWKVERRAIDTRITTIRLPNIASSNLDRALVFLNHFSLFLFSQQIRLIFEPIERMTNDHRENENKVMKNGAGAPAVCLNVRNELQTSNFDIEILLKEFVSRRRKTRKNGPKKRKKKEKREWKHCGLKLD